MSPRAKQKTWTLDGYVWRWRSGGRAAEVRLTTTSSAWIWMLSCHGKEIVSGVASTEEQARAGADDEIAARGWGPS